VRPGDGVGCRIGCTGLWSSAVQGSRRVAVQGSRRELGRAGQRVAERELMRVLYRERVRRNEQVKLRPKAGRQADRQGKSQRARGKQRDS
jgi:hypothetical protein